MSKTIREQPVVYVLSSRGQKCEKRINHGEMMSRRKKKQFLSVLRYMRKERGF